MTADSPPSIQRLRWQCRRGMRELDELLGGFLDQHYPTAPQAQKEAFAALLALPDPVVAGYLLQREQPPDAELARLVRRLAGVAET